MHIRLAKVGKRFSFRTWALRDVTLDVEPGQVIAVLGPNGAGKTTLLRCLAGLIVPSHGRILYDGEPFNRQRIDLRRRLMFLSDFPQFLTSADVVRRIAVALTLYETESPDIAERVANLLREFELSKKDEALVDVLSRGQAYKASLVALLAIDPQLWLLDEPLASGMDPFGIMAFKRHAREAAQRGRTVIYTTQILDAAESFSDRVCVIDEGRVQAFERIDELSQSGAPDRGVLEELFERLREGKS